jgi:hypothetical protein
VRQQERAASELTADARDEAAAADAPDPREVVFELCRQACEAYGRPDLSRVVDLAEQRWREPHVRVVVLGEFKKGKSTLINALVGAEICPTDDDVPTAVPTVIHHAEAQGAVAVRRAADGTATRSPLPTEELARIVTGEATVDAPTTVEVGLPRRLLSLGLQVMDTPGVGGLVSAHAAATRAAAASGDAVLFVTDALQELTAVELETLGRFAGASRPLAIALTKIDVAPAWRRIQALDARHLDAAGIDAEIFPLAAPLRRRALETGDPDLNVESGYDALVAWLSRLARSREQTAADASRSELTRIVRQLEQPLLSEREVLEDPSRLAGLVAGLQAARERAHQLESSSQGWQQLLSDRVADVTSAIDHDLRRRVRDIGRETEQRLGDLDPADVWDEFEPWLRRRVADDVALVLAELQDRATEVVDEVLERFSDEEGRTATGVPVGEQVLEAPMTTLAGLGVERLGTDKPGLVSTGLAALRGVQGGALMFGMVGNMIGLTIAGPVLVGIGLVMGGRSLVEEQRRQLTARRQQARQAVRSFLDDVSFHVGKDVRDALRLLQRGLRDALHERAATVKRTVTEALEAAEQAAAHGRVDNEARRADVEAELERLQRLEQELVRAFAVTRTSA